jgi:hypothetical protein
MVLPIYTNLQQLYLSKYTYIILNAYTLEFAFLTSIMRIYSIKHARRVKAANSIKQQWIKSYYDPKYKLSRGRLLRQFHEL